MLADLSPRARAWNAAITASPGALEQTVAPDRIEGSIPAALRGGRLLANGPGWTRIGGRTAHPFDGHGYVRAFELGEDGSCRVRARFVDTPSYRAERAAGRLVVRGLATQAEARSWRPPGFGPARHVANTTITRWRDRLLVGWEGGAPYALDPATLETRGEEHFGGALAGQATLAHMRHDRAAGRLVLCSVKQGARTAFTFREVDASDRVVATTAASVEGMPFAHDFAMTPGWFVLGGNPLRLKPWELAKMLVGASTLLGVIATDPRKPGVLHLVSRGGQGPVRTVALPDRAWVVHFGNAFERDGAVIVHACVFHAFELGAELGYTGPTTPLDPSLPDARRPQRLYRITVPAGATAATWEPLAANGVDFPRFHPDHEGRETPLLFGAARKDTRYADPFDSILGVDLRDPARPAQLWTAPEHVFVGEPVFAPEGEKDDDGHVLAMLSDGLGERSVLAIFEARALERGPVASIPLPLFPLAFHGEWEPRAGG